MSLTDEVQFEDDFEPAESSRGSSGGHVLPVAALAIPVISGSVLLLLDFSWISIAISVGTVLATTVLMTIDATIVGRIDRDGRETDGAPTFFLGMCLMWLVFFPLAFYRRSKVADPNLTLPALVATVFFLSVPWMPQVLGASGLPKCDSPEVRDLLVELVRGMSMGEDLESIDGHREVRFDPDAEVRYGHCVAHTRYGDMNVDYQVEWKNRKTHQFTVRVELSELPACNHPIVLKILEQLLRQTLTATAIDSIDGYQEVRFDAEDQIRFCRCLVHSSRTDIEIRYLIEWQNRENGEFLVRIPPPELPACDSPEVIQILDQIVRNAPIADKVSAIDGYRELRFDAQSNVRSGRCVVRTSEGDFEVLYKVEWINRERGEFQVVITEE